MNDESCVTFLQWALPRLHMRWAGFRKVRNQVCKRIDRRVQALELPDVESYPEYLQRHAEEWRVLDEQCRVTITRFFRDRQVFSQLQSVILPELLRRMAGREETTLRIWSSGCASGEEPYSLNILWQLEPTLRASAAQTKIEIVATDSDTTLLDRAREACYPYSSIKIVPEAWRGLAFDERDGTFCLRPMFKQNVEFSYQDVRGDIPYGLVDLILCRNLAFTYFDIELQNRILRRMANALHPDGILVIGVHEALPPNQDDFLAWSQRLGIYQRRH